MNAYEIFTPIFNGQVDLKGRRSNLVYILPRSARLIDTKQGKCLCVSS